MRQLLSPRMFPLFELLHGVTRYHRSGGFAEPMDILRFSAG
jgi:hypothetical protein